ncbi:hypothetical protein DAPPUDRAFT_326611 [Daphnia pulex]|uniref:Uncharacterized protein n=1 Tax=Daphnia pulex TaxID=6669 RepID=E9H896_DAPPU|nr:hypothetical protein DAPPUDRAFT_326611 [Daphnia pulex]|eukprot:EFX72032.1 hypothetical protein DAPPUDRAFT_326611 [Daphnia pulex]
MKAGMRTFRLSPLSTVICCVFERDFERDESFYRWPDIHDQPADSFDFEPDLNQTVPQFLQSALGSFSLLEQKTGLISVAKSKNRKRNECFSQFSETCGQAVDLFDVSHDAWFTMARIKLKCLKALWKKRIGYEFIIL